MKKETLRVVPIKNYIILGVILLFSFLLLYYLYLWFENYKETKLNMPILDKYMEVINYNELEDYLIENPNAIIYVSVLENSDIRNFEKKVKTAFRRHEISKEILYMDITNDNVNRNDYKLGDSSIADVPVVLVFDSGILKSIYSVYNNNYDIEQFKKFIDDISFSIDGEING